MAGEGFGSTFTETVDTEMGQTPFVIDHWNTLIPIANPVTPEFGAEGDVITPGPAITAQTPDPIVGMFAASTVAVAQIV